MEGTKMITFLRDGRYQSIIHMMDHERALPDAKFVTFLLKEMLNIMTVISDQNYKQASGLLKVAKTTYRYGGAQGNPELWRKVYSNYIIRYDTYVKKKELI